MDADGLTFVVATTAEERVAKRLGLNTVRVGVCVANGVPEGSLVSFGLAGSLGELQIGDVLDATRVVDETGATLWEGPGLGVRGARGGVVLGGDVLVHDATERERLREASGADAVDMESGVLARSGRLAGVVRAISDDAGSAVEGVDTTVHADGRTNVAGLLRWVFDSPRRRDSLDARRAAGAARTRGGGGDVRGRVLLAAPRSFCAGVDRAIEIVERLLEQYGPPVYVRHQIVHNEHVVRRLEKLGAVFVEDEGEIPEGEICVLSAHGVAPAVKENAERRGLRVVDATCPLVNKVHAEARRYADSGHLVALVGHKNHVEVIGTLGERPDSTVVIESPEQAKELDTEKPVAVITQTTLSLDDVAPIVDALEDHLGTLRRPHADDICYATQNRQDAVKAMVSQGATLVLVIGSETSSNAQRLVEVAQAAGAQATLVDGESALDEELLNGHETIGLTAGASTPEELVRATAARLAEAGYALPEEIEVAKEDVHFRLPKEVAQA